MEGWPEGWLGLNEGELNERFVNARGRYVLYGEREGCRRAAWAIEGGEGMTMDREALAMALRRTRLADAPDGRIVEWESVPAGTRAEWLQVADDAIRLLSFEPRVSRAEMRARIEELEQRNERLTATANAAVARAEEAQLQAENDGSTVAQVRALVERVQQVQETERLRRALDAMARGVAHMATAVSEMVGGGESGEQP